MAAASCSVSPSEAKAKASDDKNFQVGFFFSSHNSIVSPQADCISALEGQIVIEFQASLQYLLMAAHFSQVFILIGVLLLSITLLPSGHGEPAKGSGSFLGSRRRGKRTRKAVHRLSPDEVPKHIFFKRFAI